MKTKLAVLFLMVAASLPLAAQSSSAPPAGGGAPQQSPSTTPAEDASVHDASSNAFDAPESAPKLAPDLFTNRAGFGVQAVGETTNSSKFEEYRDVPEGLTGPELRIFRSGATSAFLVTGDRLAQDDRRLAFWADTRLVGIDAFYDQIPHRLGNEAKSILVPVGNDAWGLSDLAQRSIQSALEAQVAARGAVNYAFLRPLVEPLVNTPYVFDLGYTRKRAGLSLDIMPDAAVDTRISFFQENRDGNRAAGTSFGFGNVVETAEPIRYRTRDVGVRVELPFTGGLVRGGFVVNQFVNDISSYTFDNPFRATHSTDPNAYQAPAAASINGAAFGRMALAPDSTQATATAGFVYKMPMNSRLTADFGYGRITSSDRLIPYTTNTAITAPLAASDPLSLPVQDFEGKINTTSVNVAYNIRPLRNLGFRARYRLYDVDNNSPRIDLPGYVRFDASWNPIERITVPYGWKNQVAEIIGSYDLGMFSFDGGFRQSQMERTFRETEETTENIFHVAADVRPLSWLVARTSFEFGSRDFDHYDQTRGESASFHEEEEVNLPGLRRFDQAKRDTQRIVAMIQATPFGGPVRLSANFVRYFDDYEDDAEFGLLNWRTQSLNVEADYTPSDRWNVFAFAGTDVWGGFQRGRQSGATFSTNPADNWTAYNTDKSKTWGAGANFNVIPDRLELRVNGQVQTVNGRAQLESPPGGTPDLAFDVNRVDDTRFIQTLLSATYHLSEAWDISFGGWLEHYDINDDPTINTQMYMPGGFFLVPNDADYQGNVAFIRTSFHW